MKRFSKSVVAALSLAVMAGTAVAQDAPEGEPAGTEPGAETTTTEPAAGEAMPAPEPAPMATTTDGKGTKMIGIDVAGILPLSDYGDVADFGIGGLVRFEYGLSNVLSITGRAGVITHIGTPEGSSLLMIPVLVGAKYDVGTSGLFAYGELGLNWTRVSVDGFGSDSETDFGLGAGVGYQAGKIQARAGLYFPDLGEAGDAQGILISVGYDIAAL